MLKAGSSLAAGVDRGHHQPHISLFAPRLLMLVYQRRLNRESWQMSLVFLGCGGQNVLDSYDLEALDSMKCGHQLLSTLMRKEERNEELTLTYPLYI